MVLSSKLSFLRNDMSVMTDIRATSVNDSLNCLKLDLQPHSHTPINLSKVVYFRHIFCQYQHFTSASGMSRPEKFWPKRTNLQMHCRQNLSRVKIWRSRQRACLHRGRWSNPPNRGRKIKRVYIQSYKPGGAGLRFLEVVAVLAVREAPQAHVSRKTKD